MAREAWTAPWNLARTIASSDRLSDDRLGFGLYLLHVLLADEALGVELVLGFGARGTGSEPAVFGHHLQPADALAVAGRARQDGLDRFAREFRRADLLGGQFGQLLFLFQRRIGVQALVHRVTEALGQRAVRTARIAAGARRHFGREQVEDDAVLVGGPNAAVPAQEGGAGAFFASEQKRAVEQTVDEPLEAHRHLDAAAAGRHHHLVDHAAGHQRFAHARPRWKLGPVLEQVARAHRKVVIRIEQTVLGDDAVAVVVGVVPKGDIVPLPEGDQAGHGVRRRTIHADFPVR